MRSPTVIVDFGLCNIDSISRAVEDLGSEVVKTRTPSDVLAAERIILPGVGSFDAAMRNLTDWGLSDAIRQRLGIGSASFLGICLGMQLMATQSEEGDKCTGLGLIDGEVVRLKPVEKSERIPHIGWNEIVVQQSSDLLAGIPAKADFYFVHSYHLVARDPEVLLATTPYCGSLTSVVQTPGRPVFGVQFHPEKSQRHGQRLLRNFLDIRPC